MRYYLHNFTNERLNKLKSPSSRVNSPSQIEGIHLFYMNDDSIDLRLSLRNVINTSNQPIILISEDSSVMELSWKTGVDYFIKSSENNPILPELIKATVSKLVAKSQQDLGRKLRIKSTDRIDYIDPNDISYILGDGNYSKIFYQNGEILVSKNLKSLEQSLSDIDYLNRYGKSVILNVKRITSIEGRKINFENNRTLEFPKYSNGFKDLKKKLLWKTV